MRVDRVGTRPAQKERARASGGGHKEQRPFPVCGQERDRDGNRKRQSCDTRCDTGGQDCGNEGRGDDDPGATGLWPKGGEDRKD